MQVKDINLKSTKLSKKYKKEKEIENLKTKDIEKLLNNNIINIDDIDINEIQINSLYKIINNGAINMNDISKDDMKKLLKKIKILMISDLSFLISNFTFFCIVIHNMINNSELINKFFTQNDNFLSLIYNFTFLLISSFYIDYHVSEINTNQSRKIQLQLELNKKEINE